LVIFDDTLLGGICVYWIVFSLAIVCCSFARQQKRAPRVDFPSTGGPSATTPVYDRNLSKAKYARPASIPFPPDNQFSKQREMLGRTLFFDPRLSGSGFISCASCHNPGFSWGDGLPKAIGRDMKALNRRTPTILNTAWADLLFWDGRAESLEEQALGPISAPAEMNQPLDIMIAIVSCIPGYKTMFSRAYPGEQITAKTVARALATFERTIISERAPFDEWVSGGESAVSEDAKRGFDLFNTKAACAKCHSEWNFTDNGFHDTGLRGEDKGRGEQLPLEAMQHAFKTPTLRNIDRRGPFMHDGSEPSLKSVIELYDKGGVEKRPSLAPEIVPLHLTEGEQADLIAFLKTLTSSDKRMEFPILPR
jgi:cytochrome c peroxidase